ncbi:MAG: polyphosphate polymerase domain-containing protein [Bacteroides sp.]|nr:polyphosphate polymerase domain-containing protein [Bacteroides sp.]
MLEGEKRYRHELKYIINSGCYEILRQRLKAAMKPDGHGKNGVYRITSLYLDDVFETAYNDKILGFDVRKKYRVRFYDLSPEFIRLELKNKKGSMVSKSSVKMTYEDYKRVLKGDNGFFAEERFAGTPGEELYVSDRLVRISPAAVVDYVREAYVCAAGNVRLTFDRGLKTMSGLDALNGSPEFYNVFENGEVIFEVKYDGFIPAYVRELLAGMPFTEESISKYVLCRDFKKRLAK